MKRSYAMTAVTLGLIVLVGGSSPAAARPDPSGPNPVDRDGNVAACVAKIETLDTGVELPNQPAVASGWNFATLLACDDDWYKAKIRWFTSDYKPLADTVIHDLKADVTLVSDHFYDCNAPSGTFRVSTAKVKVKLLEYAGDDNPHTVWLLYEQGYNCL